MKHIRDEVFPYQIPETADDFANADADKDTIIELMRKWGMVSVKIDGRHVWFESPPFKVMKG